MVMEMMKKKMMMMMRISKGNVLKSWLICGVVGLVVMLGSMVWLANSSSFNSPTRILVDTDADADDIFALFYLLKQPSSLFHLQGITINGNGWSDAGHAVNHLYDMLFMMGRDDIPVGVGGDGGISPDATISPNLGGYLPLIDQGVSTAGQCRYRQAIPVGGRLNANTNFGLRKYFLPQGKRRYIPMKQPTAQQVMKDAISAGPTAVFLMGAHTNLAIFLLSNPHLKKNIKHVYAMGGAIREICSESSHGKTCSNIGNLWPPNTNPYAEFNIFGDPFAAYTVLHSGIPVTLVPLDATSTIPVNKEVFLAFEQRQNTYEAKYCFQSLKMARDTWPSSGFFEMYSMWDSFMVGVALSQMYNLHRGGGIGINAFSKMEYLNLTIVTSNEPYGISDGSNPFVNGRLLSTFGFQKNGVHSGHVQTGMLDPFCLASTGKGKCQDGYTKEADGSESVQVLVAVEAKSTIDTNSSINKAFYISFLDVLNSPRQTGRFDFRAQFPKYREVLYRPNFGKRLLGKPVIFDMDMSTGDFLTLLYLLKTPIEIINLKGIIISPNGWATAATIDVVYDVLHMMGRDDISVGLGDLFAIGEEHPLFPPIGDCKYTKAIPLGSGGFLDSDTLYGFARDLPRSPRRYTAENSVKFGAFRDTDHPELRQMSALDVWKDVLRTLDLDAKITVLTSGPLTNLAKIIHHKAMSARIEEVYITGGHISYGVDKGNLFTIPSNEYSEFNFFLDPIAADLVFGSGLNITLIPLNVQRRVSSFYKILKKLKFRNRTPEAWFSRRLLYRLYDLKQKHHQYHHVDMFLGEVVGAVSLAGKHLNLKQTFSFKPLKVISNGGESKVGQTIIDGKKGKWVRVLESIEPLAVYEDLANALADEKQTAVIASFES
ncbi:nucleoside hydrolase 3-like isoform X2 [Cucumis melo]|uniref:Nucleoside hydrolase 3-like isoform X2 n=1 Tax=Cucumis melo TaxID=3656 RepID=A0A1S3BP73_CUCME|nr:nucleoside hydrolase 3-like isoform X2 [Cucumis melo]